MTWKGLVINYHNTYYKNICKITVIEAYIQSIILKKTIESVSFKRKRCKKRIAQGLKELEQKNEVTMNDTKTEYQNI